MTAAISPSTTPGKRLDERAQAKVAAVEVAAAVLGDYLHTPNGLRFSPLGAEWSRDIDAYVRSSVPEARLLDAGWLPLDPLGRRLGRRGSGHWAVTQGSQVLAPIDIHVDEPPEPVAAVLDRCRRRGRVTEREVRELVALRAAGAALPSEDRVVSRLMEVARAAGLEDLEDLVDAGRSRLPLELGKLVFGRRAVARVVPRRNKRVVLAVSGVDGSGKSTLAASLQEQLERAGLPVTRIWARPGMQLRFLKRLAVLLKRATGQKVSGVRHVAQGMTAERPSSRKGLTGWVWSMLVTFSYLTGVRRSHLGTRGVVIYDRHLLDALVTLDFVYSGSNLSLQHKLVRVLMPKADWSFYLDLTADEALARKTGVVFGKHAVERQLDLYAGRLPGFEVAKLDATRPPEELIPTVLERITAG